MAVAQADTRASRITALEDAMARRLVESLSGVGTVHAGDQVLRTTRYEVSVWSDDGPSAPDGHPDAGTTIEGHIDITGIAEAVVLAGPSTLTLTMKDGRRLAIQLTSTGGAIVGRGWLPPL
jgi:hypothetical protein